jgi:hypothetical protein
LSSHWTKPKNAEWTASNLPEKVWPGVLC